MDQLFGMIDAYARRPFFSAEGALELPESEAAHILGLLLAPLYGSPEETERHLDLAARSTRIWGVIAALPALDSENAEAELLANAENPAICAFAARVAALACAPEPAERALALAADAGAPIDLMLSAEDSVVSVLDLLERTLPRTLALVLNVEDAAALWRDVELRPLLASLAHHPGLSLKLLLPRGLRGDVALGLAPALEVFGERRVFFGGPAARGLRDYAAAWDGAIAAVQALGVNEPDLLFNGNARAFYGLDARLIRQLEAYAQAMRSNL